MSTTTGLKKGSVKFFNESKGFGFIIDDETDDEIFTHSSGLNKDVRLFENNRVTFDTIKGKKGLNAVNVSKA